MKLVKALILGFAVVLLVAVGAAFYSRAHADAVPGPNLVTIAVSTAGGCPTPTFTGSNSIVVMCGAPDGLYVSSVQSPTPTKVNLGSLSVPVRTVFGRTGDILPATGDYSFSQIGGVLTLTQLPSAIPFTQMGGTITPAQMPASQTCTMSGTISGSGSSTISLSGCH